MRLAIISDDSLPTSRLVHAKMLHELAEELLKQGHTPIIITPGKPKQNDRLIIESISNVKYWKFRSGNLRGQGKIRRAINETLLSFKAWFAIRKKIISEPFDGVIYYSPSIFFGLLVKKIKEKNNCKSYLILRDKFPQWAVDEGLIKKGSLIEKYFNYFEHVNYCASDFIGLMSPKNLSLFKTEYKGKFNTHVLYNWADVNAPVVLTDYFDLRETLGLKDKVIFFYGGNIGHAQDMGNLLRLAGSMKVLQNAHFIFLGQGDEVDLVKSKIVSDHLTNTTFINSVSQERYRQILAQVDVGLFSLAVSHRTHNFPGKLLGYMIESLPILGSVNPDNDLIDIITDSNAGFVFVNGQDEAFFEAAKNLAQNENSRKLVGQNSRELLVRQFSVESAAGSIIKCLAPTS